MTQVAAFLVEMEEYIAEARSQVALYQEIDLHALDARIGTMCDMVMELSGDERMQYEERLQKMLAALNDLGNEMKEKMGAPEDLQVHKRASVAYKTADSRDNFGFRKNEDEK